MQHANEPNRQRECERTGGGKATAFAVNNDSQITATVPTGAKTGKIVVTTPGGTATSATSFTVT